MSNLQKTHYPVRLNKFLSSSGICSRRKADEFIKSGIVKINNSIVSDPYYQVQQNDLVFLSENKITLPPVTEYIYIALNKPKDYIVTKSDPFGRKSIFELLSFFDKKIRLFSVGRLDRNTTGVLLFTNDGDLANKLMHPSQEISKLYKVTLNKNLSTSDMQKLLTGISLSDGLSIFDSVSFYYHNVKNQLLISIHSGKNRIIRRTFEKLNYEVKSLDRTSFAGIEKKDIKPGFWRYLNPHEILNLKNLCKPF
jgi:23S rRNA pseudouridine2605 synthase